jgi:hypothetical protein
MQGVANVQPGGLMASSFWIPMEQKLLLKDIRVNKGEEQN